MTSPGNSILTNHPLPVGIFLCIQVSMTAMWTPLTGPSVKGLFLVSRPAAVFRTVVSVVVDPLDSHPRRTFPQIFKEGLERIDPAVTNRYAPLSVFMVIGSFGVETSGLYCCPATVFSGTIAAPIVKMAFHLSPITLRSIFHPARRHSLPVPNVLNSSSAYRAGTRVETKCVDSCARSNMKGPCSVVFPRACSAV